MKGGTIRSEDKDPLIEKFQQAMAQFESLISHQKQIEDTLSNLSQSFNELSSDHEKLSQSFLSHGQRYLDESSLEKGKMISVIACHKDLQDAHATTIQNMSQFKSFMTDVYGSIRELTVQMSSLVKTDKFQNLKSDVDVLSVRLGNSIDDYKGSDREICKQLEEIRSRLSSFITMGDLSKSIGELGSRIAKLSLKVDENHQVNENSHIGLIVSTKNLIDQTIATIPKPEIPTLDDAKKHMEGKLEPVALDAKNAHIRSVNSEYKITILEKKVEQLQLLLNKYQLQG